MEKLDIGNVITWDQIKIRYPKFYNWMKTKAWLPSNKYFVVYPDELQLFTIFGSLMKPLIPSIRRNLTYSNIKSIKGIHVDWESCLSQSEKTLSDVWIN